MLLQNAWHLIAGQGIKKAIPDKFWANSGKKISQDIMDGVKSVTLGADKVPTVSDWNTKFFKKPEGFDYKPESWKAHPEMIARSGNDLHHIIPQHIMKRLQALGIKPGLGLDATPGHLLPKPDHVKLTASMAKVLTANNLKNKSSAQIITMLANFYDDIGENAQAKIVRAFFN